MEGKKRKPLLLGFYAAVALSVVLAGIFYGWPTPFDAIDAKIYDYKFRWRSRTPIDPAIVHLDIDDQAVKKFGLWPWDRNMSASIIDRLTEFGAAAIVFDIFFPLEGKSSEGDRAFLDSIARSGRVVSATALRISNKGDPDADRTLDEDDRQDSRNKMKEDALHEKAWPLQLPLDLRPFWVTELPDAFIPLPGVILASKEIGHISSTPDADGVHRRIPLFVLAKAWNRYVPSLSLAALAAYWQVDPKTIRVTDDWHLEMKHTNGLLSVPLESDGTLLVDWPERVSQGSRARFPAYSVCDVMKDKPSPAVIAHYTGKIVLIAYAATGTTDMGINSVSNNFLLSRIHTAAINTMLTGRFIRRIHSFPYWIPLMSLVAVMSTFGCLMIRHRFGIILEIAVCAAYVVFAFVCFSRWSYEVPVAAPLLLLVVTPSAFLVLQAIHTEWEARRVSGALQRYLSPQMLESILGQDSVMDLSTRRKELSILFADIKGFSTISETVEVEYLEKFLNDFFEAMTRAVFDNQGTVDKFLGDGLLAFFGDPLDVDNHALAACKAAMQMHSEMANINRKWSSAGIGQFANGIQIRIGINTGMVVVGNIGSQRRMEYTVVGSAVNVASRLQEAASPGGTLISARTYALAHDRLKCQETHPIKVKGVERNIMVCEVNSVL